MNRHLLSTVAVAALLAGTTADPVRAQLRGAPAPVPMGWSGFYMGLNAGGAWGRSRTTFAPDCNVPPGLVPYICDNTGGGAADAATLHSAASGTINASGFTGGIQAGYNWQVANWLVGVESDFGAFQLKGSRQASGTFTGIPLGPIIFPTAFNVSSSVNTDWLWTLRGRLGWLLQPALLAYVTGGLAVTRIETSFTYSDNNPPGAGSASFGGSATKAGWTLGGGLEWAINDRWTVKGEYLYIDFGTVSASGPITVPAFGYAQVINTSTDLTAQIARLGINYRF